MALDAPIEDLATQLWGEKNESLSTRKEARYGSQGSKKVNLEKQTWYDHEAEQGGGYIDLYDKVHGTVKGKSNGQNGSHHGEVGVLAAYDYFDEDRRLLYQVVRKIPKKFVQRRPDGNGGWIWSTKGTRLVPYRLPQLLAASVDDIVFIVEGEKDCDRLAQAGFVATTNPGGAGKWLPTMCAPLAGRQVVIIPDNDEPGHSHAEDVRRQLRRVAASVGILTLHGLGEKQDVSDWLSKNGSPDALGEMARDVLGEGAEPEQPDAAPRPDSGESEDYSDILEEDTEIWSQEDLPKRPWIAEGFLLSGAVTLIVGQSSAGKSLLGIGAGVACALGVDWGPVKPRPGSDAHRKYRDEPANSMRVTMLNAEDNLMEQKKRISSIMVQLGRHEADLRDRLARLHPRGLSTLIRWVSDPRTMERDIEITRLMDALTAHVRRHRPRVIIIDPIIEIFAGEETNEPFRALVAFFRRFAVDHALAIILVHHTRKGSEEQAGNQDVSRGGGALTAAARIVLTCMPMSLPDSSKFGIPADLRYQYVRLDGAKTNYSIRGHTHWFEKFPVLLANDEITPSLKPWTPDALKTAPDQDLLLTLATEIGHGMGGQPYSPTRNAYARSVRLLFERYGVDKRQEQGVLDALKQLGIHSAQYTSATRRQPAGGMRDKEGNPPVEWLDPMPIQNARTALGPRDEDIADDEETARMSARTNSADLFGDLF